uniref:Uncharacterized protein n=4 Tax=Cercopithecidae TaxID=9527 RepID=A0A2K5KWJ6_CERAT|nr:unnamed protein product [Macaca fascicularis]
MWTARVVFAEADWQPSLSGLPISLPANSTRQSKHLDTSTSRLIPVWTEPPLASELEFCS